MPFGLDSAPGTFQRCMAKILQVLKWQTSLVYLDDIIIFAKTSDEHLMLNEEQHIRLLG